MKKKDSINNYQFIEYPYVLAIKDYLIDHIKVINIAGPEGYNYNFWHRKRNRFLSRKTKFQFRDFEEIHGHIDLRIVLEKMSKEALKNLILTKEEAEIFCYKYVKDINKAERLFCFLFFNNNGDLYIAFPRAIKDRTTTKGFRMELHLDELYGRKKRTYCSFSVLDIPKNKACFIVPCRDEK